MSRSGRCRFGFVARRRRSWFFLCHHVSSFVAELLMSSLLFSELLFSALLIPKIIIEG